MGFDEIIGYENEKQELMQLASMLNNMDIYRKNGVRLPKGMLLCGEPGVGKTRMAHCMGSDKVSIIELRAADCCGDELSDAIRHAFEEAKEKKPAVLLLDELDKVAGTSDDYFMESNDEVKRILLQELDDLKDEDEVLVVATCNDEKSLGKALTRPGRFDHTLQISLPDRETRRKILTHYFKKISLSKRFSKDDLVRLTAGFSCAELECLVNEMGIQALHQGKKSMNDDDAIAVINRLHFKGAEKTGNMKGEALRRVAVHEAGHTLVAMMLTPDAVYGASVLPQGDSLGHVRMMEANESGISTEDARNQICIGLAGRVAEREILGKTYLGSESDLNDAALHLMTLITAHAAYGYKYLLSNFAFNPGGGSEEIATSFTKLFEQVMEGLDKQAAYLIEHNRQLYDRIVEGLVSEKTLTREQLFAVKELAEEKISAA